MFGRLITAIFYAAIFFALGAWSGGRLEPVGSAIARGAQAVAHGATQAWNWAFRSGDETPQPVASNTTTTRTTTVTTEAADESAPATAPAASAGSSAAATDDLADLAEARQAFSGGDVKAAIAGYKAFLVTHPSNADAHGELGNIYYFNGEVGEAANSYYSAGLYLLAEGRTDEANALLPAIRIGAPALADDLQNRISLARATQ